MKITDSIRTICLVIQLLSPFLAVSGSLSGDLSSPEKGSLSPALKSLPYLTWVSSDGTIEKKGVTIHDLDKAFPGLNLYTPRNLSTAYLIDNEGNILHTWSAGPNTMDSWQHIKLCENGDLLAIVKDKMLLRLDWNSNLLWTNKLRFHHDVTLGPDNDIYSIIRKDISVSFNGQSIPVLADYLVRLSPDGKIKKQISVFDLLGDRIAPEKYESIARWLKEAKKETNGSEETAAAGERLQHDTPPDLFHTNSIEPLPRKIAGIGERGDLLISVREMNLIAVIDPEKEKVVWSWGPGVLDKQHHPTVLDNDNILIFDNGPSRYFSRILEIDPKTGEIKWEYKGHPPQDFYSFSRGSCRRLPNGNTLITESDKGRVFEITSTGETVWEFYSPEINTHTRKRAAIYRMDRVTGPIGHLRPKNLKRENSRSAMTTAPDSGMDASPE